MNKTANTIIATGALALATTVLAPIAHADTFITCPGGTVGVASSVTSCQFAQNVQYAYNHQPGNVIAAYSPVTGVTYTMACDPTQMITFVTGRQVYDGVECYGGNDARVVFGW